MIEWCSASFSKFLVLLLVFEVDQKVMIYLFFVRNFIILPFFSLFIKVFLEFC